MKHFIWILGLAVIFTGCKDASMFAVTHSGSYKFYPGLPTGTVKYDYKFTLKSKGDVKLMSIEAERYKVVFNAGKGVALPQGDSIVAMINVRVSHEGDPRDRNSQTTTTNIGSKIVMNNEPLGYEYKGCSNCGTVDLQSQKAILTYQLDDKEHTVILDKFDEVKSMAAP